MLWLCLGNVLAVWILLWGVLHFAPRGEWKQE